MDVGCGSPRESRDRVPPSSPSRAGTVAEAVGGGTGSAADAGGYVTDGELDSDIDDEEDEGSCTYWFVEEGSRSWSSGRQDMKTSTVIRGSSGGSGVEGGGCGGGGGRRGFNCQTTAGRDSNKPVSSNERSSLTTSAAARGKEMDRPPTVGKTRAVVHCNPSSEAASDTGVDFDVLLSELSVLESQLTAQHLTLTSSPSLLPPSGATVPNQPRGIAQHRGRADFRRDQNGRQGEESIFKDYSNLTSRSPSRQRASSTNRQPPFSVAMSTAIDSQVTSEDERLEVALGELSDLVALTTGDATGAGRQSISVVTSRRDEGDGEDDATMRKKKTRVCENNNNVTVVGGGRRGWNAEVEGREGVACGMAEICSPRRQRCQDGSYCLVVTGEGGVGELEGIGDGTSGGHGDSAADDNISLPSSGSGISVAMSSHSSSGASSSARNGRGVGEGTGGGGVVGDGGSKGHTQFEAEEHRAQKGRRKLSDAAESSNDTNSVLARVYSPDGGSQPILLKERMTVEEALGVFVSNNRVRPSLSLTIVEQLPKLYMERLLEDHEILNDVMQTWTTDSDNRLILADRPDKYDVFFRPERHLGGRGEEIRNGCSESMRQTLIQELSQSNWSLPEMEGPLYLKSEGKKSWKKMHFVLRASGIYYSPKGKTKTLMDLICLQKLDLIEVFTGVDWKRKHKAPNDFGFSLKHPQIQRPVPKYIKYLCAEEEQTMWKWITSIRMAKYGRQLHDNYTRRQVAVTDWRNTFSSPDTRLIGNRLGRSNSVSSGRHSNGYNSATTADRVNFVLRDVIDHRKSATDDETDWGNPPENPQDDENQRAFRTFRGESPENRSSRTDSVGNGCARSRLSASSSEAEVFPSPVQAGERKRSQVSTLAEQSSPTSPVSEMPKIPQATSGCSSLELELFFPAPRTQPIPANRGLVGNGPGSVRQQILSSEGVGCNSGGMGIGAGGNGSFRHAVIRRAASIGHRDFDDILNRATSSQAAHIQALTSSPASMKTSSKIVAATDWPPSSSTQPPISPSCPTSASPVPPNRSAPEFVRERSSFTKNIEPCAKHPNQQLGQSVGNKTAGATVVAEKGAEEGRRVGGGEGRTCEAGRGGEGKAGACGVEVECPAVVWVSGMGTARRVEDGEGKGERNALSDCNVTVPQCSPVRPKVPPPLPPKRGDTSRACCSVDSSPVKRLYNVKSTFPPDDVGAILSHPSLDDRENVENVTLTPLTCSERVKRFEQGSGTSSSSSAGVVKSSKMNGNASPAVSPTSNTVMTSPTATASSSCRLTSPVIASRTASLTGLNGVAMPSPSCVGLKNGSRSNANAFLENRKQSSAAIMNATSQTASVPAGISSQTAATGSSRTSLTSPTATAKPLIMSKPNSAIHAVSSSSSLTKTVANGVHQSSPKCGLISPTAGKNPALPASPVKSVKFCSPVDGNPPSGGFLADLGKAVTSRPLRAASSDRAAVRRTNFYESAGSGEEKVNNGHVCATHLDDLPPPPIEMLSDRGGSRGIQPPLHEGQLNNGSEVQPMPLLGNGGSGGVAAIRQRLVMNQRATSSSSSSSCGSSLCYPLQQFTPSPPRVPPRRGSETMSSFK